MVIPVWVYLRHIHGHLCLQKTEFQKDVSVYSIDTTNYFHSRWQCVLKSDDKKLLKKNETIMMKEREFTFFLFLRILQQQTKSLYNVCY